MQKKKCKNLILAFITLILVSSINIAISMPVYAATYKDYEVGDVYIVVEDNYYNIYDERNNGYRKQSIIVSVGIDFIEENIKEFIKYDGTVPVLVKKENGYQLYDTIEVYKKSEGITENTSQSGIHIEKPQEGTNNYPSDYDVYNDETIKYQCRLGKDIYYRMLDKKTVLIYGKGDIDDGFIKAYSYYEVENGKIVESYVWADKIQKIIIEEGITSIGENNFGDANIYTTSREGYLGYEKLKSIEIANTVTSIGAYAFAITEEEKSSQRNGITEKLIIPASVKTIGEKAFYNHKLSGGIQFNKGIEVIGAYAFGYTNINQKKLELPEGLKRIGKGAFENSLSKVEHINLPTTLEFIDSKAFESSRPISNGYLKDTITIKAKNTKYKYDSFWASCTLILPSSSTAQKEATREQLEGRYIVDETKKPTLSSTSKGEIVIKMKRVSGIYFPDGINVANKVKGYQIKWSKNKDMSNAKSVYTKKLEEKITGLQSGKNYYIQVRAYIEEDYTKDKAYNYKIKVYNNWSPVGSIKVK